MNRSSLASSDPEMRRKRVKSQNHLAHGLAAFFLMSLLVASVFSPSSDSIHSIDRNLAESNNTDYSAYSCIHLFDYAPNSGEDQCRYAKSCNRGEGIFLSRLFCSKYLSYKFWFGILSPFLILWMVMLFRMLGSTAEDYFSPPLEMFSVKLGLPPRFAGVSLLALGNGAADVSATRNAMIGDIHNGYLMSLGALTGAAMFIGTVVAGMIVLISDGVPCRGALVRDVTALMMTAVIVLTTLHSGVVGPASITSFTTMYLVFVTIVLVADVYHRAVVLPRLEQKAIASELQRQQEAATQANEVAGDAFNDLADQQQSEPTVKSKERNLFSRMMTALSNYDTTTAGTPDQQQGWGIESEDIISERPFVLHGANGVLTGDPRHRPEGNEISLGNYAILEDGIDRICVEPGGISAYNWRGAWKDGLYELEMELYDSWRDLINDDDLPKWEKFLLLCEFPFTILRRMSVSIPCEGYYSRSMVATSLVLSPVWFAFYLWSQHELNAFLSPPIFYVHLFVCAILGALVLRYAPSGDGVMNLLVATPIALYGFAIAATWIDWIADHLVALLELLGIVCRIPGPILGLTILAWGNSMADLSANMAMARKGLGNMAMVRKQVTVTECIFPTIDLLMHRYRRLALLALSSTFL
jgi:solute carrier family 24 (sodium/potassium/calcium exchanger), member 6